MKLSSWYQRGEQCNVAPFPGSQLHHPLETPTGLGLRSSVLLNSITRWVLGVRGHMPLDGSAELAE